MTKKVMAFRLSHPHVITGALAVFIFVSLVFGLASGAQPFTSVEMQFADASAQSGLAIIPASCPSSPHRSNDCSTRPNPDGSCPDGYVLQGGVCVPGPTDVCPNLPGKQVSVPSGYSLVNGQCVAGGCPRGTVIDAQGRCNPPDTCPDGSPPPSDGICKTSPKYACNSFRQCVVSANGPYTTSNCDGACGPGPQRYGCNAFKQCIPNPNGQYTTPNCDNVCGGQCPNGQKFNPIIGRCEVFSCPVGWIVLGNECVFAGCPPGYLKQGGQCIKQCVPQYFCSGSDLYYKNAQCSDSFIQACVWGCTAGACNPPPAPQGDIRVSPALVKSGDTTQVIWSTQYTTSCTVTGTNGNTWTGVTSGSSGKTSSPIVEQTTFTLSCNGHVGATPPTLTDSATVNLIPYWQED